MRRDGDGKTAARRVGRIAAGAALGLAVLAAAPLPAELPAFSLLAQGEAAAAGKAALPAAATDAGTAKGEAAQAAAVMIARPVFSQELPGEANEKALAQVRFSPAEALTAPLLEEEAPPESFAILGKAEATQEQMAAFIERRNPKAKLACSIRDIVRFYYEEAEAEGICADIALCQALKETGFFAYGGDVLPEQNNYCGLGATGNKVRGASFATPRLGVRAHIQHLLAYATTERPKAALVDPRYELVRLNRPDVYGNVRQWTGLNGIWAVPGTSYGQDILLLWREAKAPDASDAALAFAEKKLAQEPSAAHYIYRAIVRQKRGETQGAAQDIEAALRLAPKSAAARYDSALFHMAAGNRTEAQKDYETLVREHPDFFYAWYNLGLLELAAGRDAAAIRSFGRVLALVPQSANAQNNIGIALVRRKRYEEAWAAFSRAAAINTANTTVLKNQIIFEACLK